MKIDLKNIVDLFAARGQLFPATNARRVQLNMYTI